MQLWNFEECIFDELFPVIFIHCAKASIDEHLLYEAEGKPQKKWFLTKDGPKNLDRDALRFFFLFFAFFGSQIGSH